MNVRYSNPLVLSPTRKKKFSTAEEARRHCASLKKYGRGAAQEFNLSAADRKLRSIGIELNEMEYVEKSTETLIRNDVTQDLTFSSDKSMQALFFPPSRFI